MKAIKANSRININKTGFVKHKFRLTVHTVFGFDSTGGVSDELPIE